MPTAEFIGAITGLAPRGYSLGRPAGPCIWIVIHTTDGSETNRSAEDGNAYDARRTDDVSTHCFVDSDSVVQEINSWDRAWAARTVANNRGYHVELCGLARQTALQWDDKSSFAELILAAQHCARVALKLGIPAKWVTKADVEARRPGFMTHAMVSSFLEGTHTDPGPNFPFVPFINQVSHWMSVYTAKPTPYAKEETMKLFQVSGEQAIWKTDGINAWHIDSMAEVRNLNVLFGSTANITSWPKSIQPVLATHAAVQRAAPSDALDDDDADTEQIRGEHK